MSRLWPLLPIYCRHLSQNHSHPSPNDLASQPSTPTLVPMQYFPTTAVRLTLLKTGSSYYSSAQNYSMASPFHLEECWSPNSPSSLSYSHLITSIPIALPAFSWQCWAHPALWPLLFAWDVLLPDIYLGNSVTSFKSLLEFYFLTETCLDLLILCKNYPNHIPGIPISFPLLCCTLFCNILDSWFLISCLNLHPLHHTHTHTHIHMNVSFREATASVLFIDVF